MRQAHVAPLATAVVHQAALALLPAAVVRQAADICLVAAAAVVPQAARVAPASMFALLGDSLQQQQQASERLIT